MDYNTQEVTEAFEKVSKINSAGMVNSAINNLWLDYFRHYKTGQFLSCNSDLDCIWTILGGEVGIEGSDSEKKYFAIEASLDTCGVLQDNLEKNDFEPIQPLDLKQRSKQKALLMKKALFLRRLQNNQGKGTAYLSGDDEETE